jgi:hypothetical protein
MPEQKENDVSTDFASPNDRWRCVSTYFIPKNKK